MMKVWLFIVAVNDLQNTNNANGLSVHLKPVGCGFEFEPNTEKWRKLLLKI